MVAWEEPPEPEETEPEPEVPEEVPEEVEPESGLVEEDEPVSVLEVPVSVLEVPVSDDAASLPVRGVFTQRARLVAPAAMTLAAPRATVTSAARRLPLSRRFMFSVWKDWLDVTLEDAMSLP
ncbi:hypothetical protein [Subtercola boreus]|uniref:Uncharacterized protein n=1 Tax=Subtercola boreus TaxID=120213 RepID=A0A3E0WAG9_9MICO|nr:hypothetical protein [Subtercola boreus]RFA20616.1 hypothetical protein B7R24_09300 [Subtercola boreus]RFA20730.1 hypothetical protein B7R23_09235 [Subtercola boreus]RFA26941.1 hypothetical protein B7R25_09365 [Subtercola boreus]